MDMTEYSEEFLDDPQDSGRVIVRLTYKDGIVHEESVRKWDENWICPICLAAGIQSYVNLVGNELVCHHGCGWKKKIPDNGFR